MRIATFLPHGGVFGGVRRFVELGNAWVAAGHEVTLYLPHGQPPGWIDYAGRVAPLEAAIAADSDLALTADPHTYPGFRSHRAALHLYYCVIERDAGVARAAADRRVLLAANSGALRRSLARRFRRPVLDGVGGINLRQFRPDPARRDAGRLRVLLNGRRSRPKKGTDLVLRAIAGLKPRPADLEILLFDHVGEGNRQDPREGARLPAGARFVLNPTQSELVALYQSADLFVAAERKAGWCNTALEALACGCALVCTRSGTQDFARHGENALVVGIRHPAFLRRPLARLLRDEALRRRLAEAGPASAAPWSWERLAAKLLEQLPTADTKRRAPEPAA